MVPQWHLLYAEPLSFATRPHLEPRDNILVLHIRRNGPLRPLDGPTTASCQGQQQQLAGMLFQGSQLVATYTWPVSTQQHICEQPTSYMTAAVALPPMETPGALQLVLVQQQQTGDPADTTTPGQGSTQIQEHWGPSAAFARLPLLFLPPGAVQEVEDLLAPAMRAEVATAAAEEAAAAGGGDIHSEVTAVSSSSACQQAQGPFLEFCMHGAVWQHWVALADDVASILSVNGSAASAQRQALVREHVVPTVLSFLQQLGLQQFHDLLSQKADQIGVCEMAEQQTGDQCSHEQWQECCTQPAVDLLALGSSSTSSSSRSVNSISGSSAGQESAHAAAASAAREVDDDCPGACCTIGSSCVPGACELPPTPTKVHAAGASSSMHDPADPTPVPAAAAAAASSVGWRTCWAHFPPDQEQVYVAWKSRQHLWLDQYAAAFVGLHLLALMVRMVWERNVAGTMLYLWFVCMRWLPYLPLAAGRVALFCRSREAAWAAAQLLCVLPIIINVLLCDQRLAPYTQNWGAHVRAVVSAPFAAEGQLSPVSSSSGTHVEVSGGAAAMAYIGSMVHTLQQVMAAAAAAAGGWQLQGTLMGSVCSALVVPAAPMRALWACYGELAVVALLPLVQPLRLKWYLPGALLEVLCVGYAFTLLFPVQQVVVRFGAAFSAAVLVAYYTDRHYRTTFLCSTGSSSSDGLRSFQGAKGGDAVRPKC